MAHVSGCSAATAPNETICEGTVFTANATATNEITVLWTTGGTSNGTFTNANTETAQYTPGSNDINDFTLIFSSSFRSKA